MVTLTYIAVSTEMLCCTAKVTTNFRSPSIITCNTEYRTLNKYFFARQYIIHVPAYLISFQFYLNCMLYTRVKNILDNTLYNIFKMATFNLQH